MRRVMAWGIVSLGLATATASAQPPAAPTPAPKPAGTLKIVAAGGLLGQIEGFCEDPGGSYDWEPPLATMPACAAPNSRWLGGTMGLAAALGRIGPPADRWLLLTGNNQPPGPLTPFWSEVAALQPRAVALAEEDFFRLVRHPGHSAKDVEQLIAANPRIPFIATNVAIRQHAERLNDVKAGAYELTVADDATVPWFGTLKLTYSGGAPTVELEDLTAGSQARVRIPLKNPTATEAALDLPHGLRPGTSYRLHLQQAGATTMVSFKTDLALTPRPNPGHPFDGFPLEADGSRALIINLVDPDTRDGAADASWKWTLGGVEHELVFLDPVKTVEAILKRDAATAAASRPRPIVVLISSLADNQTLEVLEQFPEIRFVILPPESALLGRASRADANRRLSGDLGFGAIVDRQYDAATKIFARPEWFAETLVEMSANVEERDAEWRVGTPATGVAVVPGARLDTKFLQPGKVTYTATLAGHTVDLQTADQYRDCPKNPTDTVCQDFRATWTSIPQLAALAADAIRTSVAADLALVSTTIVDPDYAAWVNRTLERGDSKWLSRYVLERTIYASPRYVRAEVSGSALIGMLQKALTEDPKLCIAGMGLACPSVLDKQHPERVEINARRLNPQLFYSVAMPDTLAEELDLEHDDERELGDVVESLHDHLRGGWHPGQRITGTLPKRLEHRFARRWEGYWAFHALDLGHTRLTPEDPEERTGVRANLPISFRGAELTRTVSAAIDSDLALWDAPRFALRVPLKVDYARRKDPEKTTYEQDEFSVGGRFDVKFRWAGELRLFGGAFVDGQIAKQERTLTASRPMETTGDFKTTETASFKTPFDILPRRYRHVAGGIELTGLRQFAWKPGVTAGVKTLGARLAYGTQINVPAGVTIGDQEQDLDVFLGQGAAKLLNTYFAEHRDSFTADTRFHITSKPFRLVRPQFDLAGELKWKREDREYSAEITTEVRLYEYRGPALSPFQLTKTIKYGVKMSIPIFLRLKIVPAYSQEWATIEAPDHDIFKYSKFDVKISWPFVARWGRGNLVR